MMGTFIDNGNQIFILLNVEAKNIIFKWSKATAKKNTSEQM